MDDGTPGCEAAGEFDRLAADIAASFVDLPPEEVDAEIERALGRVCKCLEVQIATVDTWTDPGKSAFVVSHEWAERSASPVFRGIVMAERFPWLQRTLKRGEPVLVPRLDDLPPEAAAERAEAEQTGLLSIIWVPFRTKRGLEGHIALNSTVEERAWSERDVDRLRLVGQIFASAIDRRDADLRLQAAYAEVRALKDRLEQENLSLRASARDAVAESEMVGRSPALQRVLHQVAQVGPTDSTVLVVGETGTGKELVARAVHAVSQRSGGPFVTVNCAALPESLLESELFGHEKGAFTGAASRKLGRFEIADGGTLFLDEIGELPGHLQVKLLRFLQDREFERLGSAETRSADTRVVAATNRDLESMVEAGDLRADFYFRLGVFPIHVPPLRERRSDIPLLVWFFVGELKGRLGKRIESVPKREMAALESYSWPGNVRELQNIVERAMILSPGPSLEVGHLLESRRRKPRSPAASSPRGSSMRLADVERKHLVAVLEDCGWRIRGEGGAAERLGLKRTTLQSRMKKLGIQRPPP